MRNLGVAPSVSTDLATKGYVDGTVRTVTANTTALNRDVILADATSGPITITVPIAAGSRVIVKKVDNSVNNVTVVGSSGTIDGDASATLTGAQAAADFVGDGTNIRIEAVNGVTGSSAATVPLQASISSLSTPIVIAHRGGVDMAPEHTMRAYRTALAQGADMIEQDLTQLADGSFAVIHDATIDRVTTGTGNVNAFTAHGFSGLNMNMTILPGSAYGDASVQDLRPLLWTDVLREFGNKVLLCPEVKTAGAGSAMLTTLQRAAISPDAVLVQSFNQSDLLPFIAAGYKTIYLGSTDGAAAKATGHWAIGPVYTAVTSAIVTTAHTNGIKVIPYTIDRRFDRDSLLGMGVDGYFVNDPMYIKGDTMLRTTDTFRNGYMIPGMQENGTITAGPSLQDPPNHSKFYGTGTEPGNASYWGYDVPVNTTTSMHTMHGYLNPPNPSAYTINFNLQLIAIATPGTDTTRWASMFLGNTDVPFLDNYNTTVQANPNVQGYHFLMRASGQLDIFYMAGGATTALSIASLAPVAGNAFSTNEEQAMRIQVTATNLTLTNVTTAANVTIAHSTIRPLRYINMGMSGAAWRFKGVTVS